VKLPVGVSAFAEEIYQAPKSWAEKAYAKLVHYSNHPKGTHFAAWEQPALLVSDVRATFKSLRSGGQRLRQRIQALRCRRFSNAEGELGSSYPCPLAAQTRHGPSPPHL